MEGKRQRQKEDERPLKDRFRVVLVCFYHILLAVLATLLISPTICLMEVGKGGKVYLGSWFRGHNLSWQGRHVTVEGCCTAMEIFITDFFHGSDRPEAEFSR